MHSEMLQIGQFGDDSLPLKDGANKIAIIVMPFSGLQYPSLATGLLKSILNQSGFECQDFYFNLLFAERIGIPTYLRLIEHESDLAGECAFSGALYNRAVDAKRYCARLAELRHQTAESYADLESLLDLVANSQAPAFLESLLTEYDWGQFSLIGFTSTFQQHVAALAFARILKHKYPSIPIAFGGANVAAEMGEAWISTCPFIDYVCLGEGDIAFPKLLSALRDGKQGESVAGIAARRGGAIRKCGLLPENVDLNTSPTPDFTQYFKFARHTNLTAHPLWDLHAITIEGSRGCWWGEKHHCTFCGLNGLTMKFRGKAPERMYAEIKELSESHACISFQAVDNIMDRGYEKTLLRWLDRDGADLSLFFEVKANLRLDQLRSLARGGVRIIQPGIESLSSRLLKLMKKGVRGIQNVFLLKWSKYFEIDVAWNVLSGFYGEEVADYTQQAKMMKCLHHLQPPNGRIRVTLERFSPMFNQPADHGVLRQRPYDMYYEIYTSGISDMSSVAYYFDYELDGHVPQSKMQTLDDAIASWKESYGNGASLHYRNSPAGFVEITDRRDPSKISRIVFKGMLAKMFEICSERIISAKTMVSELAKVGFSGLDEETVTGGLNRFLAHDLAVQEENMFFVVAVPENRKYWNLEMPDNEAYVPPLDVVSFR